MRKFNEIDATIGPVQWKKLDKAAKKFYSLHRTIRSSKLPGMVFTYQRETVDEHTKKMLEKAEDKFVAEFSVITAKNCKNAVAELERLYDQCLSAMPLSENN